MILCWHYRSGLPTPKIVSVGCFYRHCLLRYDYLLRTKNLILQVIRRFVLLEVAASTRTSIKLRASNVTLSDCSDRSTWNDLNCSTVVTMRVSSSRHQVPFTTFELTIMYSNASLSCFPLVLSSRVADLVTTVGSGGLATLILNCPLYW